MKKSSPLSSLLCLLAVVVLDTSVASFAANAKYYLYVGTYTKGESKGIYAFRYDASSGKLSSIGLAAATENPSFLAVSPDRKFLYAVNENQSYKGEASGAVSAFTMNPSTGKLTFLNQTSSHGADPCYISLDRTGRFILVANYTGGTVAVFPRRPYGGIGESSSVLKDEGPQGPRRDRQDGPHAHWIETSAGNRFAYVADLGLDRVLIYRFDAEKGTLSRDASGAANPFAAVVPPGTGPRHVAFSTDGSFMYVLGELDSTVTVFANDKEVFRQVQKISALPAGFSGTNDAAEIELHPSGKFLYTSNRGNDSIAAFAIDGASGLLTALGRVSTQGKTPRNFTIDPTGARLLVANQDTNSIVVFTIDAATGRLTPTGQSVKAPSPVDLVFAAVP